MAKTQLLCTNKQTKQKTIENGSKALIYYQKCIGENTSSLSGQTTITQEIITRIKKNDVHGMAKGLPNERKIYLSLKHPTEWGIFARYIYLTKD